MKNSDILDWISNQVEIVLLDFADELDGRNYFLTTLNQFEANFVNEGEGKTLKFIFSNMYKSGLGIQPLQNVIFITNENVKSLSEIVDLEESGGAFLNHFRNRTPGQSRGSIFKALTLKYFLDAKNI